MSVVIPEDIFWVVKMTEDSLKLEIAILFYKPDKVISGSLVIPQAV